MEVTDQAEVHEIDPAASPADAQRHARRENDKGRGKGKNKKGKGKDKKTYSLHLMTCPRPSLLLGALWPNLI